MNTYKDKIKGKEMKHYEIEMLIDEITPCLRDNQNNTYIDTEYETIEHISSKAASMMRKYEKWNFDWSDPDLDDCSIYALYVKGSKQTQGLIACREYKDQNQTKGYIEVVLAEANPKNVGKDGKYKGVGAHLFSIASKLSLDLGYDGYVTFISKTDLVQHYIEELHAKVLFGANMQLDPEASKRLVEIYNKKARDMNDE